MATFVKKAQTLILPRRMDTLSHSLEAARDTRACQIGPNPVTRQPAVSKDGSNYGKHFGDIFSILEHAPSEFVNLSSRSRIDADFFGADQDFILPLLGEYPLDFTLGKADSTAIMFLDRIGIRIFGLPTIENLKIPITYHRGDFFLALREHRFQVLPVHFRFFSS